MGICACGMQWSIDMHRLGHTGTIYSMDTCGMQWSIDMHRYYI